MLIHSSYAKLFSNLCNLVIFQSYELKSDKMWWVDHGWMPDAHQTVSVIPLPQLDKEEKNVTKAYRLR